MKTTIDKNASLEKLNKNVSKNIICFHNVLVFINLFYSVGLRHMFISKVILVMGGLCIEEVAIAFMHANKHQI